MLQMIGLNISWRVVIMCHWMNQKQGDQGLIHIMKHELTLNGGEALYEMMDFYKRKENLTLTQNDCNTKLSKIKLDWNYKGDLLKFFLAFQNVYLDLEYCTGKNVPEKKKIGALNPSMGDSI
eukprot:15339207-Ditylum_brightwellii.AAC.1